jgi:hypothetical protein
MTILSPDINRPDVLREVREVFARYEQALVGNDTETLDALFWHSDAVVRYGATENLVGIEAIRAFRAARSSVGLARTLDRTMITTFGTDFATAMTEFRREGNDRIGRQGQTWVRFAEGWRIVAAHVSLIAP